MCHNSVQFLSNGVSAVKSIILLNIKCLQLSKTKGNSDKEPKPKQDQAQSGNQFSSGQTNQRGVIIPGCITSQIVDCYQSEYFIQFILLKKHHASRWSW